MAALPKGVDHFKARQMALTRWGALKNERSSWWSHWKELSEYVLPRSGRFFVEDRNRGERRHNNIYDSTGTRALRVLAAGMMSGMTSPSRPWFRLAPSDRDMLKYEPVQLWLEQVSKIMEQVFARSNTYRTLHIMYEELGAFGTAASIVTPNFDTVIHHHALTCGEYAISTDANGKVDTLYREFQMTVNQMVGEFGYKKLSTTARSLYDRNQGDQWVTVIHLIEPRRERDYGKADNQNMPWKSCYFEVGGDQDQGLLRESGFRRFPVLAPRWALAGGDIYGNSPAMEALGDIKQLQHEQLRKAQGIDYKTKPPLMVPASLKGREIDTLPGGVIYVDNMQQSKPIQSAFEVSLDLSHLLNDIQDVRERIRSSFYVDMFLMLSSSDMTRMTATEVAERHQEKLVMLGPVLERLQNELLDPLVSMTYDMLLEAKVLPPPPQEIQGQRINIEFVSMLAQAQRAAGVNSVDRFVAGMANLAQMKPEVLDKFNADKWADSYSEMLGMDSSIIISDDDVAKVRALRAQQMQQAQQQQMMMGAADMAQKLSATDTQGKNALTDLTKGAVA